MPRPTPSPVDPRDHITLTRTIAIVPGDARWAAWSAGFDAQRAATVGPPCPAEVAKAQRLAAQERILFGAVRTRGLLRGALE